MEVIGKNIAILVPDRHRNQLKEFVDKYLKNEGPKDSGYRTEGIGLRKDGGWVPLEASVNDFSIHGRRMFTCILRDIAERKEIEGQLRKLSRAVEQSPASVVITNRDGTIEYVNPRFEKLTGYSSDEAIGNNPRILKTGMQDEYVRYIEDSGNHLLGLINDILYLSKVEAGKMKLEPSPVVLKDLFHASIAMLKERALKHNVQLSLHTDPVLGETIEADERKVKQILFNLLTNAVKFTPEGGSVMLTASQEADCLLVCVEDTGIGIKADEIGKLFSEFTQLESVYTKKYEGTGLGLALTKRLVELHAASGEHRHEEHEKGRDHRARRQAEYPLCDLEEYRRHGAGENIGKAGRYAACPRPRVRPQDGRLPGARAGRGKPVEGVYKGPRLIGR